MPVLFSLLLLDLGIPLNSSSFCHWRKPPIICQYFDCMPIWLNWKIHSFSPRSGDLAVARVGFRVRIRVGFRVRVGVRVKVRVGFRVRVRVLSPNWLLAKGVVRIAHCSGRSHALFNRAKYSWIMLLQSSQRKNEGKKWHLALIDVFGLEV